MPIYSKYLKFKVGSEEGFSYTNGARRELFEAADAYPYDDDEKTKMIMQAYTTLDGDAAERYSAEYNYELYTKADDFNYHIKASDLELNSGKCKFVLEFWFKTSDDYDTFVAYFDEDKKLFFNAPVTLSSDQGHRPENLEAIDNVDYKEPYKS